MTSSLPSYYFSSCHCKGSKNQDYRSCNNSLPTIKRAKYVDRTRNIFKFGAENGIFTSITSKSYHVVSVPGKFCVRASSSPNGSPSSWQKWVLGFLLTVILPAAGYKGGIFLNLKSKIDKTIETVEHVAEMVELVAEEAEKIVEEVEEKLPEDSKIKKKLQSFDALAKRAVDEAKKAEDAVHKVKDVEEEIEETLIKTGKVDAKK
ncbi:hypothetical protein ABFX02_08G217200 [Erythranthe guttata]